MPTKSSKPASTTRTARTAKPTSATAPTPVSLEISSETIARRAYELYVQDGAQDGRDLDHWLRAERELVSAS